MARDRKIDPTTGDYISDSAGGTQTTLYADTAIYHQIMGELGHWAGDPGAGSRLYRYTRAKSIAGKTVRELQDVIREALQPLVDEGRISEPDFQGERELDRVITSTTVRDLHGGGILRLSDVLPSLP